ncbi:uncharacterized protein H6S33_002745 [Morchella sextelata]|uniref:uncharacterized protein n=1 Tax=Morchella sextelata TaxID=1174677 RepID=UPI001D039D0C|nr:uncharacterized protein H6S33_002745 [Morchella sextelata]KAH0607711.1 hypothetical protein H6S33_002745 [Morchella sextelata]
MPSDNNSNSNSNPPHTPPELPSGLNIVHSSPPGTPKMKEAAEPAPLTRAELLDSAQKFLESAPIMNAPLREKLEFLKTKGLTRDEMEALLEKLAEKEGEKGVVLVGGKKEEGKEKEKEEGKEKGGEKADKGKGKELVKASSSTSASTSTSTSTSTAVAPSKPAPSTTTTSSSTPAPVAPIVTYPEFLTPAPPAPPAPLMTAKTLGKSLYFATGAAATIYGANKFVLTPMYDALTSARLDLSSTALANLATLNTRLTELLPEGATVKPRRGAGADSDSDSDTSDPGELFHVDASTQTSADLGADLTDGAELSPDGKLERLGAQLQTLVESHSDGTDNELTFALEDLTSYLETLTYDWPGTNIYTSPYGGYGGGAGGKEKDKDDPVAKVKAEIRSVKGVLLNSKNFPASR